MTSLLSRAMHDSVSQALYSIALGVKTARVQVDRDPDSSFPGHLGLDSMRERVTGLGGSLSLERAAGGGTLIRVHISAVPVKEPV